ncbi:hypothetical protein [Ewingella americana]|uniref:Uncharacterized protein n=1 Tax=Ewingella americana TaxID=41202 RepID=A0A502GFN1_9GAMM|nr:hypothetical protein [Ewingella americana]TPG60100.1 hypothetical protein EAH77_16155 [Ewingella americana]
MINKMPLTGLGMTRRLETLTVGYTSMPSNRNHVIVDSDIIVESIMDRFIALGAKPKAKSDHDTVLVYHKVNNSVIVENSASDTLTIIQVAGKLSDYQSKARGIMVGINRHLEDTNYYTNVILFDRISNEVSSILCNQIEHKIRDSKISGKLMNLNFYF